MAVTNSVSLTFEYTDATTRTLTFDGIADSAMDDVKDNILLFNAAITSTVTGAAYRDTYISDAGAPIARISKAKKTVTEESVIYSG